MYAACLERLREIPCPELRYNSEKSFFFNFIFDSFSFSLSDFFSPRKARDGTERERS